MGGWAVGFALTRLFLVDCEPDSDTDWFFEGLRGLREHCLLSDPPTRKASEGTAVRRYNGWLKDAAALGRMPGMFGKTNRGGRNGFGVKLGTGQGRSCRSRVAVQEVLNGAHYDNASKARYDNTRFASYDNAAL
ncbi:MAG: hypothetical protein LR015_02155 [Verrucomicrobia bacterium]|nr:hypothetical protein [Verrucomicrobiota bacterium]